MRESRLDLIVQQAVAQGILPPGATASAPLMRPWPVIVLTALGGWLCSLPLLGCAFFLLERSFSSSPTSYFVALVTIAGTIWALRDEKLPMFIEQLSIPMLLAACTLFGCKLWDDTTAVTALWGTAALVLVAALGCFLAVACPATAST